MIFQYKEFIKKRPQDTVVFSLFASLLTSQASQAGRSSPGKSPGKYIFERSHSEDGNLDHSHLGYFAKIQEENKFLANVKKKLHERR